MPYVVVDNFSGGLDSRRHVLNSKTGTMSVLKNAHITRGGEIEKRKAFSLAADFSSDLGGFGGFAPPGAVNTFGLEATSEGLYVFGYEEMPNYPGQSVVDFPWGSVLVKYQRLEYPAFPDSTYPYPNTAYINQIVYSTVYGGKPFVIAEFGFGGYANPNFHRIPFYDGSPVKDWYQGIYFGEEQAMVGNGVPLLPSLVSYFPVSGYTASLVDLGGLAYAVDVTGPPGKSFVLTVGGDFYPNPEVTTFQSHTSGKQETLSKGSFSITGGSTTAAYAFRGYVRYTAAASLPGIRSIRVGASSASASDGQDLIGWGGATGLKYNTYTVTDPYGSDAGALLWNIRKAINDNTSAGLAHGWSARWASYGGWSGADPADIWIDAPSILGSDANDLLVQIEFDADPTGVASLGQFIDTATIAASPYNAGKFIATLGVTANGSFNRINSVKVDGVEVLGTPISWETSHGATATAVATQINAYTSSTEYEATITDNSTVVLSGVAGSGAAPNGRVISVTTEGTVVVSGVTKLSGGTDGVAPLPQISRVEFDPTIVFFYSDLEYKKISLTIVDPENPSTPIIVGASRVAGKSANFSTTYKSKEYVGVGSTLYFSAINDATKWDVYDTGSGFIDMSNNFGGREDLTGVGVYQDRLAVFSRRNVQLWAMDADPAQNTQVQILANTGCLAPDSVVSVGSIDLLYLADNGVRSLRARENTDTAFSSDIGSAIDSIVIEHMAATGDAKYSAKAAIEPIDGRYWIAIEDKIFVLSYFPGSNISAWSIYEPGFVVKEMVTREDKIYLRSDDDKIYVYGASDLGDTYDDCEVVVELPYLDANKPATYKEVKGIDITCNGEWKVYLGFDHTNPTARDLVATVTQSTFALGKIPATGAGTHFGPRFVHQSAGPALLANFIVHYDEMHSKHDAG